MSGRGYDPAWPDRLAARVSAAVRSDPPKWLATAVRQRSAEHSARVVRNVAQALADYERVMSRPRGVWAATGRPLTDADRMALLRLYQRTRDRHYGPARVAAGMGPGSSGGTPGGLSPYTRRVFGI